ncbi:unnamed protein product [Wuchereria bancrofti]|uniref:Uncharacterized protein n=1 Tax=Wuchereria bancrofti TaxID=6293 RepID=A0A3P7FKX8_WUCBA|nr:unnamed protein product [Wuchereria bancrofti]
MEVETVAYIWVIRRRAELRTVAVTSLRALKKMPPMITLLSLASQTVKGIGSMPGLTLLIKLMSLCNYPSCNLRYEVAAAEYCANSVVKANSTLAVLFCYALHQWKPDTAHRF